jgi:hypothetical protein
VYSLAGDLIYSEDAINTTTKKISMSGAAAGVYMVRVLSGDEISTIKFAVTK